jgi:hypothetical protein
MFYDLLATAIETAGRNQLDDYSRQIWRAHGSGIIVDDQAQQLQEQIQRRRRPQPVAQSLLSATPVAPRHYIQRSREQRSPDRRASLLRRRQHAATGPLPPSLATHFTTGELAALKIVADECLAHGVCDLSRNEIASRAGVSKTVAKRALKLAEVEHSMITVEHRPRSGRKHLTSITRIIRTEWLDWLRKGHRKAYAIKACTRAKPDFPQVRGAEKNPPRSQHSRTTGIEHVDNTVKKEKSDRRWSRRALF